MGNTAIIDNPPSYAIDITVRGSDWLWAAFSVMAASFFLFTAFTFMQPVGRRAFHFFGIAILATASVAYFSMASNLGKTGILAEFPRSGVAHLYSGPADEAYRSIWYARYIDWTITTPLLLLELLLQTGLPLSYIFFTIFMDLVMIETGLIGALVTSSYKWGFYAFGCVAMLFVFWVLIGPARKASRSLGDDVLKQYTASAAVLGFLWFLYPIAWGLADGGNIISPDGEMVFYGVLDLLAKPGFLAFHLWTSRNIDYERFQLQSGHFSTGAVDNFERHEKEHHHNGVANGNGLANGNGVANGNGAAHTNHADPRPAELRAAAAA